MHKNLVILDRHKMKEHSKAGTRSLKPFHIFILLAHFIELENRAVENMFSLILDSRYVFDKELKLFL